MELPYYLPGTFLPSEGRVFILQESHAEAMVGFGEEYPGARLMNTKESFRSRGDETSSPRWETNQGLRPKALTYDKSDFSQKVFCAHGPWGTGGEWLVDDSPTQDTSSHRHPRAFIPAWAWVGEEKVGVWGLGRETTVQGSRMP